MLKFEKGDTVYHSFFGTGTITSTQKLDLGGTERLYYVVKLAIGEVLMIPIKEAEEARLHTPISPEAIISILSATPEKLADDYRQRREVLETKINSGNPAQVSEAVRDLAWREHTSKLSNGDKTLMGSAKTLLSNVLVNQPDLDIREASQRLEAILKQTALAWKMAE
jgi:CarD family transcriptional regulator